VGTDHDNNDPSHAQSSPTSLPLSHEAGYIIHCQSPGAAEQNRIVGSLEGWAFVLEVSNGGI